MHIRIVGSQIDDTFGLLVATTIIKGYDYIKSRFMNVDKLSDWPKMENRQFHLSLNKKSWILNL